MKKIGYVITSQGRIFIQPSLMVVLFSLFVKFSFKKDKLKVIVNHLLKQFFLFYENFVIHHKPYDNLQVCILQQLMA